MRGLKAINKIILFALAICFVASPAIGAFTEWGWLSFDAKHNRTSIQTAALGEVGYFLFDDKTSRSKVFLDSAMLQPQPLAPTDSPTFAGLTLTGLTGGLQATAGVVSGGAILVPAGTTGDIMAFSAPSTPTTIADVATGQVLASAGLNTLPAYTGSPWLSGTLGINTGGAAPATKFQVVDTVSTSPRGIMSSQHNDGTYGARFHMRKSRGTLTVPLTIITGDTLGKLVASGYDGAAYQEMGTIAIESEGTIGAGRVPTRIVLSTATDAATSVLTERMRIDSAGNASLGKSDGTAGGSLTIYGKADVELVASGGGTHYEGDFHDTGAWILGANWTIAGGVLSRAAAAVTTASYDCGEAANHTYKVVYTINSISGTAATITMSIGYSWGTPRSTAGTFTEYITAIGTGNLTFTPIAATVAEIDNVHVYDVTSGGTLTTSMPILVQGYGSAVVPAICVGDTGTGFYSGGYSGTAKLMNLSLSGVVRAQWGPAGYSVFGSVINFGGENLDVVFTRSNPGSFTVGGTGNGQTLGIKTATTLLTIASGTVTSTWTSGIPAGAQVIAISSYVTVQPPGTATYDVGIAGTTARYSTGTTTAVGGTAKGMETVFGAYAAATNVVVTVDTNPSDATGRIRLTVYFFDVTAPIS